MVRVQDCHHCHSEPRIVGVCFPCCFFRWRHSRYATISHSITYRSDYSESLDRLSEIIAIWVHENRILPKHKQRRDFDRQTIGKGRNGASHCLIGGHWKSQRWKQVVLLLVLWCEWQQTRWEHDHQGLFELDRAWKNHGWTISRSSSRNQYTNSGRSAGALAKGFILQFRGMHKVEKCLLREPSIGTSTSGWLWFLERKQWRDLPRSREQTGMA